MKVLYVIDPGTIGGASESFLELIRSMSSKGIECIVCVCSENCYNRRIESVGGRVVITGHTSVMEPLSPFRWKRPIKYPIRWLLYRYRRETALKVISRLIDISTIDLVHTNSARNDLGCYIKKQYGIPHIVHFREFGDLDFDCIMLNDRYIDNMNKYSTCFIAISEAVKNHWIGKGLDRKKVKVIYNGVHSEDIGVSSDEDKYRTNMRMVISGGICEAKGQLLIAEALSKLPDETRKHITVDMLGWNDPHYLKLIEDFSHQHGLENHIRIVGSVNDVHKRLKDYQIGLTCSRSEGFGRVTAEYMHAQLCVIASDSGANPELIEDGKTGILFRSSNSDSLAEKIQMLYHDRDLLKFCSQQAKRKASREYTDAINSERIYRLYQKIVNGTNPFDLIS